MVAALARLAQVGWVIEFDGKEWFAGVGFDDDKVKVFLNDTLESGSLESIWARIEDIEHSRFDYEMGIGGEHRPQRVESSKFGSG